MTKSLTDAVADAASIAKQNAQRVDQEGAFPRESINALKDEGLFGLVVAKEHGGLGAGPVEFAETISTLATACGSSSMIYLMHNVAAKAAAVGGGSEVAAALPRMATGSLATLAFSEKGSRSHFWAPVSKASRAGDSVQLKAEKSFTTSANEAAYFVTSIGSADGEGVDLYTVPANADGVKATGAWSGLGLRGNDSGPMTFDTRVNDSFRIGSAGSGVDTMLGVVLPWFNLGNAAVSLGLAQAAYEAAVAHVSSTTFEHLGSALRDLPTIRAQVAKAGIALAALRSYLLRTASAVAAAEPSAQLDVLGVKALANDTALSVTDMAMRVCGGAAFAKSMPIERSFRDARAGSVMAPTADVLYDLYGRAVTGLPLM